MIYGIGTDIIKLERIAKVQTRKQRFAQAILHPQELQLFNCKSSALAIAFLAKRFAAKEAFVKALGTGLNKPFTWQNLAILNLPSGKPYLHAEGHLLNYLQQQNISLQHSHISLSDEVDCALAFVILCCAEV